MIYYTKLQRARKREHDKNNDDSTALQNKKLISFTAPISGQAKMAQRINDGHLHEFRTFDADDNVRRLEEWLQIYKTQQN